MFGKLDSILRRFVVAMWVLAGACLVVMMLLIVTDVVGRYFKLWVVPSAFEIAEILMVVVVFAAIAPAQRNRVHVSVQVLTERLRGKTRGAMEVVAYLVSLGVCLVLTQQAFLYFWTSYRVGEYLVASIRIPTFPALFVMFLGFALLSVEFLLGLVRLARRQDS